jgi:Lysyl oxidase
MRIRALTVLLTILAVPALVRADVPPVGPPVVPPSAQPPTPIGTLSTAVPLLRFHGAVTNPTPLPLVNNPVPVVCAAECQEFTFGAASTAPFLVAVHSTVAGPNGAFNPNDGFVLYVYAPDGLLVAAANGIGADGQSVALRAPTPGTYTIVVTFTYAQDPNAAYNGEVRLMSGPTWRPARCTRAKVGGVTGCFELPVLQARPAYDLTVSGLPPVASTPLGFPLPVVVATPNSCYIDETFGLASPSPDHLQHPTQRCLRFTSNVRNIGAGALEVRLPWVTASGESGFLPGQCRAEQVVFTVTGAEATRAAGPCEFHPAHGHFHYRDLISYSLYDARTGKSVGTSTKESFCLADDDYFGFASAGPNGPRNFVGQPGCNVPADQNEQGVFVPEGITPGWGDVYTWDTPDQFIDITNVAPGTYDLVMKTNPTGVILVSGPQQTCSLTRLQLTADAVRSVSTRTSVRCPSN